MSKTIGFSRECSGQRGKKGKGKENKTNSKVL